VRGCRWPSQRSTRLLSLGGEPKHAGPWLPSHALEARSWQLAARRARSGQGDTWVVTRQSLEAVCWRAAVACGSA
jgi:hypothetical protein